MRQNRAMRAHRFRSRFSLDVRATVVMLASVPLLLALFAMVWVVRQESNALAQAQIEAMEPILLQAHKSELQHFVKAGRRSVAHFYESARQDAYSKQQALELLRRMDFGNDDYFFVYDLHGNSLMHPRLPNFEGRNQWELRDSRGELIVQLLVQQAQAGGGFVDYMWNRPSTGRDEHKLGYVELIPEWGWVIGTGLYLDNLQQARSLITHSTALAVQKTRDHFLLIATITLLLVASGGLALNLHEQRAADSKLRAMSQKVVNTQEEERSRVARELHDGIVQQLVAVKFVAESALMQLERGCGDAPATLHQGISQLQEVVRDIRRISHDLRPILLDDIGLSSAIAQIAQEYGERTGIQVNAQVSNLPIISKALTTALFRFAQEALGNIEKHSGAQHVILRLQYSDAGLSLQVRDDGCGFDVQGSLRQLRSGLGLTHMRERIEMLGGQFNISSSHGATNLSAQFPPVTLKP